MTDWSIISRILNDTMKETKIHCAFFFFFALGVAVIFSILPIVQTEPRHPYSSWYPFEISSGVNFKMYATAVYEAICLLTMALLNVSTDVLIYSLIGIVHYQIQLLGLRLTQMGWNKSGFIGNFENGRSAHFTQVVECISLHWEIDRFVQVILRSFTILMVSFTFKVRHRISSALQLDHFCTNRSIGYCIFDDDSPTHDCEFDLVDKHSKHCF